MKFFYRLLTPFLSLVRVFLKADAKQLNSAPSTEASSSEEGFLHKEEEKFQTYARLPQHLALIMDGNGRWAKERGLRRSEGHKIGAETLRNLVYTVSALGIPYLTVYAFSTENWKRSPEEIEILMELFARYCVDFAEEFAKENVRIRFLGKKEGLSPYVQKVFEETEKSSKNRTGLQLILAINYSGRQDIVEACKQCMLLSKQGYFSEKQIENFQEENFRMAMYLPDVPDPDLLVRTSGEFRLSNFLLWNLAYTELYVSELYWPDFTKEELHKALLAYQKRERRFGQA